MKIDDKIQRLIYIVALKSVHIRTTLPEATLVRAHMTVAVTEERCQNKRFCFIDTDCLVVGESQGGSLCSAGKCSDLEGDSQTTDTVHAHVPLNKQLSIFSNNQHF